MISRVLMRAFGFGSPLGDKPARLQVVTLFFGAMAPLPRSEIAYGAAIAGGEINAAWVPGSHGPQQAVAAYLAGDIPASQDARTHCWPTGERLRTRPARAVN